MNANIYSFTLINVFFYLSIVLNYLIYVIYDTKILFLIFSLVIIFSFFLILVKLFFYNRIFLFFFLLLIIISLGSAVQVWDARSIFMFNAKRIFFENNFTTYFQTFSFNTDYPILYPVLAATLNVYFPYWSEIIPKISILFLSLIPLVNIISEIKKKNQLLFIFLFTAGLCRILLYYFIILIIF